MLYVSFTCLPTRIENIGLVLKSIEEQTLQPDFIIINYPKNCVRLNIEYKVEILQEKIKNSILENKIIIHETPDFGPITKIYPLVHMNLSDDDVIIIIDDDIYYNKYLFEALYQNFIKENQEKSICISGLLYPTKLNSQYMCIRPGYNTQLMEAAFGYIIKKSFIQPDLEKWVIQPSTPEEIKKNNFMNSFLSDDYVISRYFDIKNIEKKVLEYTPIVNKSNTICNSDCKSTDSLSALELNLNKYVRSEIELRLRKLTLSLDK
jgi:hypothetical protein